VKDKIFMTLAVALLAGGIAAYYVFGGQPQVLRVGMVLAGLALAAAVAMQSETGRAAWAFARGADVERRKVVWPTRKETLQTTGFVLVIVVLIGLYIWGVDTLLSLIVRTLVLQDA
jgi:preprotein translocase subunit SecE